jgi:hypothetical protein
MEQRVYDPGNDCLCPLKPIPPDLTLDMPFIGADLPQDIAKAVGTGTPSCLLNTPPASTTHLLPISKLIYEYICNI